MLNLQQTEALKHEEQVNLSIHFEANNIVVYKYNYRPLRGIDIYVCKQKDFNKRAILIYIKKTKEVYLFDETDNFVFRYKQLINKINKSDWYNLNNTEGSIRFYHWLQEPTTICWCGLDDKIINSIVATTFYTRYENILTEATIKNLINSLLNLQYLILTYQI